MTPTVTKMMFSAPQTADSSLHMGDIVGDIMDLTKFGIVVGPGQRGIKVCWTDIEAEVEEDNSTFEVDPLQLILITKAVQC